MYLKSTLFIGVVFFLFFNAQAQDSHLTYLNSMNHLLHQLSKEELHQCHFAMDTPHRLAWSRLPGKREGLKLTAFSEAQKMALHRLLRAFFPSQGYLKITSIMFNEDIQKKNEPELGKNEYWFSFFGEASPNKRWGWKLEGHHLSINMTLLGNELLAFTPLVLATNPAVTHGDGARDGLAILFQEEELARQLINSFSADQLKEGYSDRKQAETVYGELHKDLKDMPDEGLSISRLNRQQLQILKKLVAEYIQNFQASDVPTLEEILNEKARFFFIGSKTAGKAHYYKIDNGEQFIEYENYDNHIHVLWRNYEDYGIGGKNDKEWTILFDGKNVDGWRAFNGKSFPQNWTLEDGMLKSTGEGGDIVYGAEEFENFELYLEWKIVKGGNSGIFYHIKEGKKYRAPYENAPEYQVLDDLGFSSPLEDWQKVGADYAMYSPDFKQKAVKQHGEWNTSRIVFTSKKVEHWLNDKKIVEFVPWSQDWHQRKQNSKWKDFPDYGKAKKGLIGMQDHGDVVWYRNIKIRKL